MVKFVGGAAQARSTVRNAYLKPPRAGLALTAAARADRHGRTFPCKHAHRKPSGLATIVTMERYLDQLYAVLASHFVTAATATAALIGTSLLPVVREQVRAFATWALAPFNRLLPWDRHIGQQRGAVYQTDLVADFSFIQVFIENAAGTVASYRKLSSYRATKELSRYREGVSAAGAATDFATMRGTIVQTRSEHGFFISEIDLAANVHRGGLITNVYKAKLLNCFTADEEYWTQEIAFPTRQLTMHISFPEARPPTRVRCFAIEGTVDREIAVTASIVELFGKKGIAWQLDKPVFGGIYKLTWRW
jgi:hypothetical protein